MVEISFHSETLYTHIAQQYTPIRLEWLNAYTRIAAMWLIDTDYVVATFERSPILNGGNGPLKCTNASASKSLIHSGKVFNELLEDVSAFDYETKNANPPVVHEVLKMEQENFRPRNWPTDPEHKEGVSKLLSKYPWLKTQ